MSGSVETMGSDKNDKHCAHSKAIMKKFRKNSQFISIEVGKEIPQSIQDVLSFIFEWLSTKLLCGIQTILFFSLQFFAGIDNIYILHIARVVFHSSHF